MKKFFVSAIFCLSAWVGKAQTNPLWLRYPAISPDGKNIAFGYKGDIYLVSSSGGQAVPLTLNEAQDMMPVWSRDSKTIAFASNRYGNFDVFTIPVSGGTPTRLTYNSANDYPYDFSPDGKSVIFGSARNAPAKNVRFATRIFQNVYSVKTSGGKPLLVSAAGMERAHYNNDGSSIVFEDRKGYEDAWRKHHTSSVTRDIWTMDVKKNTYTKLTSFEGEDREPVYSNDDKWVYYLSEKAGNQNLFRMPSNAPGESKQLTTFKENPVRHLSRSADNTICFTQDGEIYTLKENGTPQKLKVSILNDGRDNIAKTEAVSGNVSEFSLSPNGKEIAFVNRGEIFVTAVESGQTKQITKTPAQERSVQWSPDGKSLIYATERNNSWDIYRSTIQQKDEPYFYAATVIKDEPLINSAAEEFQPLYSPDGKEIAYIENRNILKVYNIASKKTKTLLPEGRNHSYSDGDWSFEWSPDGKWILADDQNGHMFMSHAALIKADGTGEIIHPVNSGFGEGNNKWALKGKMMTWLSSRNGLKSLAISGNAEVDVYGVFFDQDAYDRANMSKDDFALLKEREDKEKLTPKDTVSTKKDKAKDKKVAKADSAKVKFEPDFNNLDNRRVKLTINSSSISDYALNEDASKLYYLASFESGYDLWVTDTRTHETKILAKMGGSPSGIEMSKDGKNLFASNRGRLVKVDAESGKVTPVSISGDITIDAAAERAYVFEHAWRQVKEKFYDPKMEGVDWERYKEVYAKFLPYINNNFDFQELLSEMLGELNASHTGGRYSPNIANADNTAALGLLYDESAPSDGLKITEVIAGGPLDIKTSKVKAGDILEKIDNETLTADTDWAKYLNNKTGKNILLSFYNENTKTRWSERVKPISVGEESGLMYKRWTKQMAQMVDRLSNGKVGYVHVQGMNDDSFREVYDVVMGKNADKKALIVDTRFNGGGWLHDDLNTFLTGSKYLEFAPQGNRTLDAEPSNRWQKPSCVVMSEGNYSDAFIFPYIYKQNRVGKLIGMPVAGTGTAVWWERQIDPTLVFGIPMVATIGKENRPTENLQVEPDIKVNVPYEAFLNGTDTQIETAVKEMLKEAK
ncbi:S41 family peptidase [Pedobacter nutrimenti]|uniref:S41 family peptidase n=1 Tax=Pedobacter nutrimenti TaxID=1241337 RepID=UPI002931605C|nr:S41 family peptidase [Pedobacter nutrimenti]